MKYVLVAGWGKGDEWHDFCIGIHDDWYTAVGHAYEYLWHMVESYKDIKIDMKGDGSHIETLTMEELMAISPPYELGDDNGWVLWTEEKNRKDDWNDKLEGLLPNDNYVRIFTFNDKEIEKDGRNKESL